MCTLHDGPHKQKTLTRFCCRVQWLWPDATVQRRKTNVHASATKRTLPSHSALSTLSKHTAKKQTNHKKRHDTCLVPRQPDRPPLENSFKNKKHLKHLSSRASHTPKNKHFEPPLHDNNVFFQRYKRIRSRKTLYTSTSAHWKAHLHHQLYKVKRYTRSNLTRGPHDYQHIWRSNFGW